MDSDELESQLQRMAEANKSDDAAGRYCEASRQRLERIMVKKLTTAFIGSVAAVETSFGILWGHGKHDGDLTDTERQWQQVWLKCRQNILDKGNGQTRAVQQELAQYEVKWNRYKISLKAPESGLT